MKNYARKTNRTVTRYRTPATFRVRAVMANQKSRLGNQPDKNQHPYFKSHNAQLTTNN